MPSSAHLHRLAISEVAGEPLVLPPLAEVICRLADLNAIEKVTCVYCGYVNWVVAYVREVAGRTEQYWCPIRHAKRVRAPHTHSREFVDYGDARGYQREIPVLRVKLKGNRPADDAVVPLSGRALQRLAVPLHGVPAPARVILETAPRHIERLLDDEAKMRAHAFDVELLHPLVLVEILFRAVHIRPMR